MRPTTALDHNVFDFDHLLYPGIRFEHPRDVVSRSGLTLAEKCAILASWPSDASAIASLRRPEAKNRTRTDQDGNNVRSELCLAFLPNRNNIHRFRDLRRGRKCWATSTIRHRMRAACWRSPRRS